MLRRTKKYRMLERGLAAESSVDRDANDGIGVIRGIKIMSAGEAEGHGVEIDDAALDQLVELGMAQTKGVKSRFGHPNMCATALGTYVGDFHAFRRSNGVTLADLHFNRTAYDTPNGDLATYLLNLAENAPDKFGMSAVVDATHEYRMNVDGTRQQGKDGKQLLPLLRLKRLRAIDAVDDPAANTSLFSEQAAIAAQATEFLDDMLSTPTAKERMVEFAKAYERANPGAIEDVISVLQSAVENIGDDEAPERADHKETKPMENKDQPAVDLDKVRNEGVALERARVTKLLSRAKAEHFAATSEYPKGYVLAAIEGGTPVEDALGVMMDLSERKAELKQLHSNDDEKNVGANPPPKGKTTPADEEKATLDAMGSAVNRILGVKSE